MEGGNAPGESTREVIAVNTLSFGRALILNGLFLGTSVLSFYVGTHFPAGL